MIPEGSTALGPTEAQPFKAVDVAAILHTHGWLDAKSVSGQRPSPDGPERLAQDLGAWLEDAAALLSPHAADGNALADLLSLVFEYDARAILRRPESHAVLASKGCRDVIRELAHLVLESPAVDSDRFKEIVTALRTGLRFRGRELFHPLRLALAGRAGEGELDRVILLLDRGAGLAFRVPVKGTRQRMLEFCASLE